MRVVVQEVVNGDMAQLRYAEACGTKYGLPQRFSPMTKVRHLRRLRMWRTVEYAEYA